MEEKPLYAMHKAAFVVSRGTVNEKNSFSIGIYNFMIRCCKKTV